MTPKEKADELIQKHNDCLPDLFLGEEKAIRCALITVAEIENELTEYGAMSGELQNMDYLWRFWEEVKTELEKL